MVENTQRSALRTKMKFLCGHFQESVGMWHVCCKSKHTDKERRILHIRVWDTQRGPPHIYLHKLKNSNKNKLFLSNLIKVFIWKIQYVSIASRNLWNQSWNVLNTTASTFSKWARIGTDLWVHFTVDVDYSWFIKCLVFPGIRSSNSKQIENTCRNHFLNLQGSPVVMWTLNVEISSNVVESDAVSSASEIFSKSWFSISRGAGL